MDDKDHVVRRWATRLLAMVLLTAGVVVSTGAPAQALSCRSLTWLNSADPPPYSTYIASIQVHRHGHFVTSGNCGGGRIQYWAEGQAFERTTACTDIRIVLYNRSHNFDRQTPWQTRCMGDLPAVFLVGGVREFSFDTRNHSAAGRSRLSHALYEPVIY